MRINSISNYMFYQRQSTTRQCNIGISERNSINFKGAKGFMLGAVTCGVMASLFTDLFFVYAALGGIIGDWVEDKNNKSNNDENNSNSQGNYRLYR